MSCDRHHQYPNPRVYCSTLDEAHVAFLLGRLVVCLNGAKAEQWINE